MRSRTFDRERARLSARCLPLSCDPGRSGGMADAGDSKSPALCGCVGSTPTSGTRRELLRRLASPGKGGHLVGRSSAGTMNGTIRLFVLLALATGCSVGAVKKPAPAATVPGTATRMPAALTPQELNALETSPGSTPSLAQSVEPPSTPVAGLGGTPGPSPAYGPKDAPVRIYLVTAFQCPVCVRADAHITCLSSTYPNHVAAVTTVNTVAIQRRYRLTAA